MDEVLQTQFGQAVSDQTVFCLVGLELCRFPMGVHCYVDGQTEPPPPVVERALLDPGVTLVLQVWNALIYKATARVRGWGLRKRAKEYWSHKLQGTGLGEAKNSC